MRACSVTQSWPTLCDPMDCSLPGSSVHGILQARILEWVAISFSRGSSRLRDQTQISGIARRFFTIWATTEAQLHIKLHTKKFFLNWGFDIFNWDSILAVCSLPKYFKETHKLIKFPVELFILVLDSENKVHVSRHTHMNILNAMSLSHVYM